MADIFAHYAETASVVDDGTRRIELSIGDVGGLELAYLGVENSGQRVDALLTLPEARALAEAIHAIDPDHAERTGGYYLYRIRFTSYPEGAWITEVIDGEEYSWINESWTPPGWDPGPEWVERYGNGFFWPSVKREYKSLSSAKSRVKLIESFGATAVVERSSRITWPEVGQ